MIILVLQNVTTSQSELISLGAASKSGSLVLRMASSLEPPIRPFAFLTLGSNLRI
jgi:hypothetical protein